MQMWGIVMLYDIVWSTSDNLFQKQFSVGGEELPPAVDFLTLPTFDIDQKLYNTRGGKLRKYKMSP